MMTKTGKKKSSLNNILVRTSKEPSCLRQTWKTTIQ